MNSNTFDKKATFYKVARHLLKQGQKSLFNKMSADPNEPICAYRSEDGLQCAIGCLIPDDKYNLKFEGLTPWVPSIGRTPVDQEFAEMLCEVLGELTPDDFSFLEDLQLIHDDNEPYEWLEKLNDMRKEEGWTDEI